MRRLLVAVPLFGLAFAVSARQHFVAPAPAPVVVAHPVPMATAHPAPVHASASTHPATRVPVSDARPVTTHRRPTSTAAPQTRSSNASNLALGTGFNAAHGVPLPGKCNHFSYPLQGLNACPSSNGVVLPFYGGGMYIPIPYYADTTAQEQPAPEGGQEEASNQQPDNGAEQQPADQEPASAAPARGSANNINESLAQFVFVQRDGTKFYAVAYSFLNDKLHYVTKDGVRHSVATDSLDFDATQKFNEELGNTINLPNLPASGVALNVAPATLP